VHRVLEELALILVLLLDVGVDVTILCLLVFDEFEERLVDGDLQLLVVVRVLDHLVNSVLKVADDRIVVPNNIPVGLNGFLDEALAHTEVLNHETETGVH